MRGLIDHLDLESCGSKAEPSRIKEEYEVVEDESLEKSILAKALLKDDKPDEEQMAVDDLEEILSADMSAEDEANNEDDENKGGLYECSTCQVQFASVEDHIREFHAGTEVVIQVRKNKNK